MSPAPHAKNDARRGLILLVVLSIVFLAFLWLYVPRMNNYVMSDREFTGWTGPIAERLARGERPYIDFILPIPPGSFAVLALIQKATGEATLLQELWVAGLSHWLMGLMAYAIAVRLTSPRNALLVAAATMVLAVQTAKECVYDHTSQLTAWLSITVGLYAMFSERTRKRHALWLVAGALASFTLAFKQSTASGIVLGWALAVLYLIIIEWRQGGRDRALPRIHDGVACFAGGVAGLIGVWLLLLAVGTTPAAFLQSVFGDAPELKGGRLTLLKNLFNYVFRHDAVRNALLPTVLVIAIGVRVARVQKTLHIGDEPERGDSLHGKAPYLVAVGTALPFIVGFALLGAEVRMIDRMLSATLETFRNIAAYGFVFATVFFVAHVVDRSASPEQRRTGHIFNALIIVVMTSSMVYNTSFIHFSPFYYNNPSIPLALLFLFVATERARVPLLKPAVFALCCLPLFGLKLNRALSADTRVVGGHWDGMRVNYRGIELLKAAKRVQQLASPHETVLVLPEDVQLAGLMNRPRPPVSGAIIFVDQYPRRLLDDDLRAIDENLPKVIVIHPRRRRDWHTLFNTWSKNSAAKEVLDHVIDDLLPKYYERDSSYPTIYFWDQGRLDVYVRKDDAEPKEQS